MEKTETDSQFGGLSKINSAMIVNMTLNELWKEFFKHFKVGMYLSANSDLDCIWTILGGEKGIEGKQIEQDYFAMEKELGGSGALQDGLTTQGFSKISNDLITKFCKQKGILLKKSLFLRRLQNKQGKGTAYEDDVDFE